IVTASGHISEIQCRRTGAANAGSFTGKFSQGLQVSGEEFFPVMAKRNPCANECAIQRCPGRNAQATAIELRAMSPTGGEFFASYRVIHYGVFKFAPEKATDGDRIVGDATNKVGGTIQGINYPDVIAVAIATATFFTEEAVLRISAPDNGNDVLLGLAVDIGDKIVNTFFVYLDQIQPITCAHNLFSGSAGGAKCNIGHGLH